MRIVHVLIASVVLAGRVLAQEPHLAPNAPKDRPLGLDSVRWARLDSAIAPLVAQARLSYPAAKQRYLAGLPSGHTFFLTTRLRDNVGNLEQVFIAVDSIRGTRVFGRIWSDITVVQDYHHGESYSFAEAQIIDWLISKPDGTEEGNLVGKFMDTYRPQ